MTGIVSEGQGCFPVQGGLSSIGEPPRLSAKRKASQSSRALLSRQRQRILPSGVLEKILDTDVLLIRQRLQAALVITAHGSGCASNRDAQQDTKRHPDRGAENPVRRTPRTA